MSDHIQKTIADFESKLQAAQSEVARLKRTLNDLCEMAGLPARYASAEPETVSQSIAAMRKDQFYGRPMATVVREYLEMRAASGGERTATVPEIYDALLKGGFKFETTVEKNAKDGLRISLAKNVAVFHKLPNGSWGLLEWYPNAKKKPAREAKNGGLTEEEDEAPLEPESAR